MQWTYQLVVKTGTPLTGQVDGPSPGWSNFVSGRREFSTLTGWLDKPLALAADYTDIIIKIRIG